MTEQVQYLLHYYRIHLTVSSIKPDLVHWMVIQQPSGRYDSMLVNGQHRCSDVPNLIKRYFQATLLPPEASIL